VNSLYEPGFSQSAFSAAIWIAIFLSIDTTSDLFLPNSSNKVEHFKLACDAKCIRAAYENMAPNYAISSVQPRRRISWIASRAVLWLLDQDHTGRSLEVAMAKATLAKMSVGALLRLRADMGAALSRKAKELESQLSRLDTGIGSGTPGRTSSLKGRKSAIKYRDKAGNTWAGRGAQPIWLRDRLKAGAKLEDFAVNKTRAPRKKAKKRRNTKRWAVGVSDQA
jgi:DNA-binding protein H-NS